MKDKLSKKELIKILLLLTIIYLLLQSLLFFFNDKNMSRFFWLEHRNAKELIDAGTPEKSDLTPVIKIISDNHFWILRAGVIATFVLALYYKDKNKDLFNLYKNITISVVILLIIASGIITWILKIIVGKPRPYTKLDDYSAFSLSDKVLFLSFRAYNRNIFIYYSIYLFYQKIFCFYYSNSLRTSCCFYKGNFSISLLYGYIVWYIYNSGCRMYCLLFY